MFWSDKRTLVTGATGMVGAWLVKELLAQGAYVVVLIRDADPQSELFRSKAIKKVTVVNGMLEDLWALERAINEHEVDTVFHLGAQTIVGTARRFPFQTFEANVRGTYNLLEACRLHQALVKRIVVASSDKAYGDQVHLPYTEETSLQGRYPYDVSKSCSDLIAQSYFHTYALPVAIARCGNIYGGGDLNWSRVVPGTIRSVLKGERPIIRSDGKFVRDYIYVKDAAQAYLRLAECLADGTIHGEGFNFSIGKPMTVLEIVEVIQKLMDAEHLQPIIHNTAKGEILSQYLSSEKAGRLLKWAPSCGLEKGLEETISWYREFFG
ncbi:MAG: NAD-dependent epimerase/dehydratase family protein [Nitrospiraceae bacterium]|nr:MAG: NAD-dependent epimerase/dehydratase family protein [Nitrospiraceae bacterium]